MPTRKGAYLFLSLVAAFSALFSINANAATCAPVSAGANATISSDCDALVLDSAGSVVVNPGVIISSGGLSTPSVINATNSISQSFINNGTISPLSGISGIYLQSGSSFATLTNAGAMSLSANGIAIAIEYNTGTTLISNLINSGTISGGFQTTGISNSGGVISSLSNSGSISGGFRGRGILNANGGVINVLTNTGTISIVGSGAYGIENSLSVAQGPNIIGALNNSQGVGNSAGALTYYGTLPTNYNIIINSPMSYGKLAVTSGTGTTTFGIYTGSILRNGTYASVLSGLTSGNLTTTTGTFGSATWLLSNSSSDIWDLIISGVYTGPSLANTNQSLVNTASALQGTYTLQNSVLANSFSYDCTVFGANDMCVSAGGRNTQVQAANGLNNTSALLIAAYRPHPNYRIGAYADQNLSVSNPGGTVNLGNNTPLLGLFAAWNERLDGTGTEVKVSAAYGQKNTTITRSVVGSGDGASEAGSGSSKLNSQGAQVTAKYGFGIMDNVIVSPYVGVRYTQNNMGGYTESTSSSVTAPLTYSALNTNATTALAGVGASYRVIPAVTTFASAGVETDTNTANGTYSATNTSIGTLTPVNFNANPVKTRPTATLGAYYDVAKNQRLGVTGIYRQEAYQAVSTTTVMATYTIGL